MVFAADHTDRSAYLQSAEQKTESGEEKLKKREELYKFAFKESDQARADELYQKAIHFYFLAAEKGNTKVQYNLGFIYEDGLEAE